MWGPGSSALRQMMQLVDGFLLHCYVPLGSDGTRTAGQARQGKSPTTMAESAGEQGEQRY